MSAVTRYRVEAVNDRVSSVRDYFGRIDRRWPPDQHTSWHYLHDKARQLREAAERLERELEAAVKEVEAS